MANLNPKLSPYYETSMQNGYLDIINFRNIPAKSDDIEYEILLQYKFRPDLLAYDLYGDSNLWWVFSVRNKDTIKDPIFDMIPGVKIFLPQITTLKLSLGF